MRWGQAEDHWAEWDAQIGLGESPGAFLSRLSDEAIIELLATAAPSKRRYELDIIATEALNRMAQSRRELDSATDAVAAATRGVRAASDRSTRVGEMEDAVEAAEEAEEKLQHHRRRRRSQSRTE